MAWIAASFTKSGPSKFGKPWPRLIALCLMASELICVKIVVLNFSNRFATCKNKTINDYFFLWKVLCGIVVVGGVC